MALPANIGTGTIRLNTVDLSGDTSDGTVTLTPSVKVLLDASATPPTTVFTEPLSFNITAGVLADTLVPATDDPDWNPTGWTYKVSIKVNGYSREFSIEVPEGGVVDLTTAAPVPGSPGVGIVRGTGIPDPSGAADNDVVSWDAGAGEAVWEAVSGVGPSALDDLSDVATTGAVDGDGLVFDAGTSTWLPGTVGSASVDWTEVTNKPTTFAPSAHNHDDRYYTEVEVDGFLGSKADTGHTHSAADITSGTFTPDRVTPGSTLSVVYSGSWPSRPTLRTDVIVQWLDFTGTAPVPTGGIENLDIVIQKSSV